MRADGIPAMSRQSVDPPGARAGNGIRGPRKLVRCAVAEKPLGGLPGARQGGRRHCAGRSAFRPERGTLQADRVSTHDPAHRIEGTPKTAAKRRQGRSGLRTRSQRCDHQCVGSPIITTTATGSIVEEHLAAESQRSDGRCIPRRAPHVLRRTGLRANLSARWLVGNSEISS
ncbi:hypothetical protein B0T14DRAFT_56788 [Immersiella caudata]|uniref:Uncharacterized protein n=1 Tax=Immersiella caudata TaxID=314043 RepID=A0AA39XFS0_9PEZI|nr:hypothetical protein B0T14DRAFT_56788 [Immersiella caudata]